LELSSLILSAILVVVIFVLAVASNVPMIATATPTSDNAIALAVVLLLWLQHAVTILLIIGLVIYIVRLVRARRAAVAE
jgi:heme/copper-type cytochrome/quinol oxidase subunit 2